MIERSANGGSTWTTMVSNSGSTATTYSDTGLAAGTTYTYRVSAINSVGTGSPSSNASATTLAVAPSPPTGLTATAVSSSQINLSWTAPNNGGSAITGYKIERSTDGGTTWTTIVSNSGSTATTYSDTGLAHTTTYTYRVSAINSVGTGSPSSAISATTLAVVPSSPTGLGATAVSSSQINLSWTAPADNGGSAITGYKIERSTDGGSSWSTLVANTGISGTTYSDTGLAHTTTYTYRVSAINSVGTSPPSNTTSATTSVVSSPPSGLAAAAVSSSQINLSWTAPADNGGSAITGYKIERSMDGGSSWSTLVANTGSTATTYSDTGLAHTTTYTYRVSAINSVGTSPPSNGASATALAIAPSPPSALGATAVSSSQINLSWASPTDNGGSAITGYMIERSANGGSTWTTMVSNSGSTATTYSDTGLAAGTTYTYRVSAINSIGTSPPSNTASATTLAVAP